ncbi:MAG TPA: hypothetical protein VF546_22565 [Pyrinomonadaceae bacterium]|jgi:hypothetical protein
MEPITMAIASFILAATFSFGSAPSNDISAVNDGPTPVVVQGDVPPPAPPTDDISIAVE